MNKNFKMNYLARDFSSIKNELKEYAKRYYSDTLSDLSEASINTFLMESVAYVGDVLSYYLDYQTNESFLATAIERKNILNLAKSLGYKRKDISSTTGKLAVYMLIPDKNGTPDYSKSPTIKKGTQIKSTVGNVYTTTEDLVIDENLIGSDYVVARVNDVGNPTYYAVKTYVPIISGVILSKTISVGNFVKFNKIFLDDSKTAEVVSVIDAEGNQYYEVSNLSQNIVYVSTFNADTDPKYILKPISAQRRFVFDYDESLPYLLFGAKSYKPDEDLTVDPVAEPTKFALNKYNNDYLQDDFFEPNKLINGDFFGVGPENTTLTVTYRTNTTLNNNSSVGQIINISDLKYSFDKFPGIADDERSVILNSIQMVNEEEVLGQNSEITIDELKDLAGYIYNSQNRAVTAKDYEALTYMMPQKYGAIKRVKAERDPTSLKNNINLYISCSNRYGSLAKSNTLIKENLKTWLSNYKIITDSVDILDAKIINLGINYTILVDPAANKLEVIDKVNEQLRYTYSFKSQVGESFNILNVYREIRKIKEVLDIKDIKIRNITDSGYSQLSFNIQQNLTSDGNMIKIPRNAIYEIKDVVTDIVGNAV